MDDRPPSRPKGLEQPGDVGLGPRVAARFGALPEATLYIDHDEAVGHSHRRYLTALARSGFVQGLSISLAEWNRCAPRAGAMEGWGSSVLIAVPGLRAAIPSLPRQSRQLPRPRSLIPRNDRLPRNAAAAGRCS